MIKIDTAPAFRKLTLYILLGETTNICKDVTNRTKQVHKHKQKKTETVLIAIKQTRRKLKQGGEGLT